MGLFPTDAVNGQRVTNTKGTVFEYDDVDNKWFIVFETDVYTQDQVDALVDTKDTKEEAHAYVEATALTMENDITFNAGQTFDGEDVSALATDLANQATPAEAVHAVEDAGLILSASKTINIDGTPADATYTGIVLDINTSGCATYDAVYIDGVNSCLPARANSINTMPAIGIVIAAGKVLVLGVVRIDATFVLAADKVVYVSEDAAGDLKDAIPGSVGDIVQTVGYTVGTDMLYVNPSIVWGVRK